MSSYGISDLIDFTRNSEAWFFNSAGLLEKAADDVPRFEYDPVTNAIKGLLPEGQRTNDLRDCRDWTTGNWTASGLDSLVRDQVGLDGVANTAMYIEGGSTGNIRQIRTIADDTGTHTVVWFVSKEPAEDYLPILDYQFFGGTALRHTVSLNKETGEATIVEGNDDGSHKVYDYGNWWRVVINMANNGSGNTDLYYRVFPGRALASNPSVFDNNGSGSVVCDLGPVFLNVETATSPIETQGFAVTRSQDIARRVLGDEFNSDAWTTVVRGIVPPTEFDERRNVWTYNDDNSNFATSHIVELQRWNTDNFQIRMLAGDSAQIQEINFGSNSAVPGEEFALAVAVTPGEGIRASLNGGAVQTLSTSLVPVLTHLDIGRPNYTTGRHWNAPIETLREIPRALTDDELQAESAL